ncbi:hypothetical protein SAMN02787118_105479 [Streptomyces mirabilis]|jgi:hypothetical protein|uniref:Uncharacterized protein n=1 Tax=Streptomyces mirabilis TaxID=68239 RepID=A0A1I2HXI5_9ACTN|nr:hypothetical protein SAMN02787118_105479 [Streptomyces mirabilis]
MSLVHQGIPRDAFAGVSHFRSELSACMTSRGDALLCPDGRPGADAVAAATQARGGFAFGDPSTWDAEQAVTTAPHLPPGAATAQA